MPIHAQQNVSSSHEDSLSSALVQVLLHVFDPLFIALADAFCAAEPIPIDAEATSTSTATSSHVKEQTSKLFSSSFSSSPAAAPQSASPPSPLNQTNIFTPMSFSPLTMRASASADAPPTDTFRFFKPFTASAASSKSSSPLSTESSENKARGRPRLLLTNTPTATPPSSTGPPQPNTSKITRASNSSERKSCVESQKSVPCTAVLLILPNSVLWEGVAALAESFLMDGPGFSWLQSAASLIDIDTHCDSPQKTNDVHKSHAPPSSRNIKQKQMMRPSSEERQKNVTPAQLLARVLLHFDNYAASALHVYDTKGNTTVGDSVEPFAFLPQHEVLGDGEAYDTQDDAFPSLAAAFVRLIALHTARLLQPLAHPSEAESTCTQSCQRETTGLEHGACMMNINGKESSWSAVMHSNATKCVPPSSLLFHSSKNTSAVTFQAVQEELRLYYRQQQQTAKQQRNSKAPTAAARRAGVPRKNAETSPQATAAAARAATSGKNTGEDETRGSAVSPDLLERLKDAMDADMSAFLLLRQQTTSPTLCSASELLTTDIGDPDIMQRWKDVAQVRPLLDAGAAVLSGSANSLVMTLSCALPEGFRSTKEFTPSRQTSVTQRGSVDGKDGTRASGTGSFVSARKSGEAADEAELIRWCAGLQRFAASTKVFALRSAETCPSTEADMDFASAAARLFDYLRERAVNPHLAHVKHYSAGQGHTTLSPAQSPVKAYGVRELNGASQNDASLRAEDESAEEANTGGAEADEPGEVTCTAHTAQWSIRPYTTLKELHQRLYPADRTSPAGLDFDKLVTLKAPRRNDECSGAKGQRRRGEVLTPVLGDARRLPAATWLKLSSTTCVDASVVACGATPVAQAAEVAEAPSTAPFDSVLRALPQSELSSLSAETDPDTANLRDALSEVGAVLACIDTVCADRTLQDVSSWRYGRNRLNIAAASFISVMQKPAVLATEESAEEREKGKVGNAAPPPRRSLVVAAPTARPEGTNVSTSANALKGDTTSDRALETMRSAVGLYHHESGVLYVAGGSQYALETE